MSKTAKLPFRLLILILGAVFVVPLLYALYNSFLPLDKVEKLVSPDQFTLSAVSYTHLTISHLAIAINFCGSAHLK